VEAWNASIRPIDITAGGWRGVKVLRRVDDSLYLGWGEKKRPPIKRRGFACQRGWK